MTIFSYKRYTFNSFRGSKKKNPKTPKTKVKVIKKVRKKKSKWKQKVRQPGREQRAKSEETVYTHWRSGGKHTTVKHPTHTGKSVN